MEKKLNICNYCLHNLKLEMDILFTKKCQKTFFHYMKTNHIIKNIEMFIIYLYQSILQILVILVYPYINKGLYELSPSHSGLGPI